MFSMAAMSTAMPTVGVRRNAPATRVAAAPATAFPAMNGMSSASLGLRSEGTSPLRFLLFGVPEAEASARTRARRGRERQERTRDGIAPTGSLRVAVIPPLRPRVQPRARLDRRFVVFRVLGFRRAHYLLGSLGVARGPARGPSRARASPPSRSPRAAPPPRAIPALLTPALALTPDREADLPPPHSTHKKKHQARARPLPSASRRAASGS